MATRRLARITIDVLLPEFYGDVGLDTVEVESVTISCPSGASKLEDLVQTSVVEARLVVNDA